MIYKIHFSQNKTPENPAKNYYIAFPALSSNRSDKQQDGKPEEAQQLVKEATFERNSKSLCWSGLMSTKESHLSAQQGGAERIARASTHSGATKRTSSKNHRLFYNKRNVQPGIFYESNFPQKKPLPAAKKKQKRQRNYFGEFYTIVNRKFYNYRKALLIESTAKCKLIVNIKKN